MRGLLAVAALGAALSGQRWELVRGSEGIAWPGAGVRTGDGFLWITSGSQIYRYDGRTFVGYGKSQGLGGTAATAVAVDGSGRLLAGTDAGLFRLEGERFRRLLGGLVASVGVSRKGLVAINDGSSRLVLGKDEGVRWEWRAVTVPEQLAGQVAFGWDGALLFGCGAAICEVSEKALEGWRELEEGQIRRVIPRLNGMVSQGRLTLPGVGRDRWGRVWVRDTQRQFVADRLEGEFRLVSRLEGTNAREVHMTKAGVVYVGSSEGVWVGTAQGVLEKLQGKGQAETFGGDLAYWDGEGSMWKGRGGGGLLRWNVTWPIYRTWGAQEGLDTAGYGVLLTSDGRALLGTLRGIYELESNGERWKPVAETIDRFGATLAMGEALDGSVLFGANRGPPTLVRLGRDRRVKGTYLVPPVQDGPNVYVMERDPRGFWWLGSSRRLFRAWEEGAGVRIEAVQQPGRDLGNDIFGLDLDEKGRLTVPTRYGLQRLDGESWESWEAKDGLLSSRLGMIGRDRAERHWVGYLGTAGLSVVRLEGGKLEIQHVAAEVGMGRVEGLLVDRRGWIWVSDERGIWVNRSGGLGREAFRRVGAEIRQVARGVNRTALHEDGAGRIWASGVEGTIRIDEPEIFVEQAEEVPVVTVSGWEFGGRAGGKLQAQLHAPRLRGMDAVRFRWRMGGEWQVSEDGAVRMESVPEGDFVFEAEAEHKDGYWRTDALRVGVRVAAPWWRTRGFVWPAAVLLLGGGYLWQRRRARLEEEALAFAAARLEHFRRQELPVFGGRYRAEELIAKGTFAKVYRAVDEETGRAVAVKALLEEEAGDEARLQAQQEREVANLRRITHPGVVGVLDYGRGEAEGTYLVMEYVAGPTLAMELAKGGMERGRVGKLARQMGEALEAAHASGVVHRDLKPANIILRRDGEEESAVIVDFGIAVWRAPGMTRKAATQLGGTLLYVAPEQLAGSTRPAVDIYSFGVILCEALTGVCPAMDEDGLLEMRAEKARELLGEDAVSELLCAAMAYDPGKRPKGVREFGAEVERRLKGDW